MKTRTLLLMMVTVLFMAGCVTAQKPMYYWEDYCETLYKYKKSASDEDLKAHRTSLENIIAKSKENSARVPPGVYCEYGCMLVKEGRVEEGLQNISLEEQNYPESHVFIERLRAGIEGKKEAQ